MRFILCLSILCILLVLLFLASCSAKTTEGSVNTEDQEVINLWAVIVGVRILGESGSETTYAINDAMALSEQLSSSLGSEHVKLLINSDATKSGVRNAITEWLDPKENADDIVVLYMAGHGTHEFLDMYDSLGESTANDLYPSELDIWLDALESQNMTIMFDFCGSGGFSDSLTDAGRVILSGCTGQEKCWQDSKNDHGVFSFYILEGLSKPEELDGNNDLNVSAEEIFNYVQPKVAASFQQYPPPSPQHPQLIDNHDGELILFSVESLSQNATQSNNYSYIWGGLVLVSCVVCTVLIIRRRRKSNDKIELLH